MAAKCAPTVALLGVTGSACAPADADAASAVKARRVPAWRKRLEAVLGIESLPEAEPGRTEGNACQKRRLGTLRAGS
ncbi:hypothetical protein GCM10010329_85980 [Streptomyces spiroverticillatus]|uniref:Uncharacterized protein n=1 Tax=Streptomyces finlayi TaxID=67296 RepID=A0A918XA56_9ACTN|nr:hypothetical protein GCM10010329_85980 [Streptomyces spiroverticillatus]GHD19905.1 hypothetical protein GCM10010334_83910 [Streptomyces finlayi]